MQSHKFKARRFNARVPNPSIMASPKLKMPLESSKPWGLRRGHGS